MKKHLLLCLFFYASFFATKAQNCKTLYDTACQCKDSLPPAVYIRNGSFEGHFPSCFGAPPAITSQQYVNYWVNGDTYSGPSYYYLGCRDYYDSKFVPLPIPDGNAFLEIFDIGGNYGSYPQKGYIATCLASPLLAGVKYRFEFYIGFSSFLQAPSYSPHNFAIFGHPSCDSIPFAFVGSIGCPTNVDAHGGGYVKHGWVQLGVASVSGKNNWVRARIDFTPTENINGFIFGPDCTDYGIGTSYFADDFSLTELSQLRFKMVTADSGNCSNGVVLHAPPNTGVQRYQWYKDSMAIAGATDPAYTVSPDYNATGNYNVRMVFPDRCIISDPFYVDLSLFGNIGLGKDTLLCYDDSLLLKPGIQNVYYLWQDGSTGNDFLVKQPGNYSVKIFNQFGCTVSKSINVNFQQCSECQLYLPSAFTPNGDGLNDVFRVKTICAQVDDFHLQIYARWGQLIFESSNISDGWDGTYKNKPLPIGTYVYIVHYKKYGVPGIQLQKGTITLIR